VFGGLEVLQCYNPHKTERFCTIGVLQRCYEGVTECYAGKAESGKSRKRKQEGTRLEQGTTIWLITPPASRFDAVQCSSNGTRIQNLPA
jgi:hypothetical protein